MKQATTYAVSPTDHRRSAVISDTLPPAMSVAPKSEGPSTILVVDDDPHLREVVRYALAREGFEVREASDGQQALDMCTANMPDLLVVDVSMPELDGFSLCRRLRATSHVPLLFLSSRSDELDRVLGIELGGDDYVTKPFSTRELVARVKGLLRRASAPKPVSTPDPGIPQPLQAGPIRLDPSCHRVWVGGCEVVLTATEFRLLNILMGQPGRVYSRETLGSQAYPDGRHVSGRTVDSHIRRIRSKFRDLEAGFDPVQTVHGVGYRLQTP
ncbi:MAG: response regulator transcription factor [Nannocystaceae bacterium]